MIDTFHPHLIINTGVAGGTGAAGILDVVLADRIAYHDIWCGPGTEEGDAAGCPRFFTPPAAVLRLPCATARGIKHGLVCSGDRFISTPAEVKHILGLYPDALAVDMESAAIAHVCHLRNVPFVCLRVISDTPGAADNIAQYENFWEDAPRHTFEALSALLAELPEQSELWTWKKYRASLSTTTACAEGSSFRGATQPPAATASPHSTSAWPSPTEARPSPGRFSTQ